MGGAHSVLCICVLLGVACVSFCFGICLPVFAFDGLIWADRCIRSLILGPGVIFRICGATQPPQLQVSGTDTLVELVGFKWMCPKP